MKIKLFTSALLIAVSLCGFSQDKATLKKTTLKMIDLTDQQDYKVLAELTYPKLFTVTPREEYLDQMLKKVNGQGYTIYPERIDPDIDFGAVQATDNGYFCIIHYNTATKVALENKVNEKDQPELLNRFRKILDAKDVFYDEAGNSLHSKKRVQIVAISDDSTNGGWSFIDPATPHAMDVLHEDIRNALNPDFVPDASKVVNPNQNADTGNPDEGKTEAQKTVEKEAAKKAALYEKQNSAPAPGKKTKQK
jgi:hypothetical protein